MNIEVITNGRHLYLPIDMYTLAIKAVKRQGPKDEEVYDVHIIRKKQGFTFGDSVDLIVAQNEGYMLCYECGCDNIAATDCGVTVGEELLSYEAHVLAGSLEFRSSVVNALLLSAKPGKK